MTDTAVTYSTRPDATPESELSALVAAYRFILDSAKKKEVVGPRQADDLEDEKERSKDGSLASTNYTR